MKSINENAVIELIMELKKRGISVEIIEVKKPNLIYDALTVRYERANIGMNISVDTICSNIQNGMSAREMADSIQQKLDEAPTIDANGLMDYKVVKERLMLQLIATEPNKDLLKAIPHKELEDLSVIFRINIGPGTCTVTNAMMENYGVSLDTLYSDALENMMEKQPMNIRSLTDVLMELAGTTGTPFFTADMQAEENPVMLMCTAGNPMDGNLYGASVLVFPGFLEKVAEKIGGDFYLLPSSVHEFLAVPDNRDGEEMEKFALQNVVMDVNEMEVSATDKLSDSIYHYSVAEKKFERVSSIISETTLEIHA